MQTTCLARKIDADTLGAGPFGRQILYAGRWVIKAQAVEVLAIDHKL